ncbi:MAG TPA: hypothetical protein VFK14_11010 [Solirubrobacterales bacterium]|nr:hypothetical protein [Solirubrobacterales bacterium]
MSERLDKVAALYDEVAAELERAAAHAAVAAQHFRDENVPRGSAHAWALHGHLLEAQERLAQQAREHARFSTTEG